MAVMLYHKDGRSVRVEPEVFRSYLTSGDWFLSVEGAGAELSREEEECSEPVAVPLSGEGIRALAKEKGIKNWYNKGIPKLKVEIEECQQET